VELNLVESHTVGTIALKRTKFRPSACTTLALGQQSQGQWRHSHVSPGPLPDNPFELIVSDVLMLLLCLSCVKQLFLSIGFRVVRMPNLLELHDWRLATANTSTVMLQ